MDWEATYGSRYNLSKGFLGYDPPDTAAAWGSRHAQPRASLSFGQQEQQLGPIISC